MSGDVTEHVSDQKPIEDLSRTRDVHDEVASTIRWTFITIVLISIFCIITLSGNSDVELLENDKEISLPGIDFPISYIAFVIFTPIILVSLLFYMHVFSEYMHSIRPDNFLKKPIILNVPTRAARTISPIILYWLVPVTLAFFTWETWPWKQYGIPLLSLTILVTASLSALQCYHFFKSLPTNNALILSCMVVLLFTVFFVLFYQLLYTRSWNLAKARLADADLRSLGFVHAAISEAMLTGANLSGSDLFNAKLRDSDLSGATLEGAKLMCADFTKAVLSGTNLTGAELEQANFVKADLTNAILYGSMPTSANFNEANLTSASFNGSNSIAYTTFQGAKIDRTGFVGAYLEDVDFREATMTAVDFTDSTMFFVDFSGVTLAEVDFANADIESVNLSGADLTTSLNLMKQQLAGAFCDGQTQLPDDLTRGDCGLTDFAPPVPLEFQYACGTQREFWISDLIDDWLDNDMKP